MDITKIIAKFAYIASWMVCFVPNEPHVKGQSYDEPTMSEHIVQIIENDEISENPEESVCQTDEQAQTTMFEDEFEDYVGNIKSEDGDFEEGLYEQFPTDYEDY